MAEAAAVLAEPVVVPLADAGPGAQRAAALLLGLGPDVAGPVFRMFTETDLRHIALGAKALRKSGTNAIPDALKAYVTAMERIGGDAAASDDMLREFAQRSLGNEMARRAFDGVSPPPPPDEVLGPVAHADPEALAMVLAREQPQTVALVLSSLDSERAGMVMEHMPEEKRAEILRRMATVESVAPEVLREVGQALAGELKSVVAGGMRKVDGKSAALEILRRQSNQRQTEVVSEIEKDDPTLAAELRQKLFTFDDLTSIADRDIQTLLKEVDTNRLTIALKGATTELKEKILRNMSSRAAQMLGDDLQAMGAVRLSTVEAAQMEIAQTALQMSEQGKITIVGLADKML